MKGKTVLIVGASGLLGLEVTRLVAEAGAGYTMATFSRHPARLMNLAAKYVGPDGQVKIGPIELDLKDEGTIKILAHVLKDKYNGLDILINCAGVNWPKSLAETQPGDFDEVLAVNLRGPFLLCRHLLPVMNSGGSVVYIGSVSGFIGGPRTPSYASAKLGLVALSANIALNYADQGIRSNVLAPGYIEGPMATAGAQSELVRKAIERIPLGRMARVEEIAKAALFLASDASSYITGSVLHVNGGLYLNI